MSERTRVTLCVDGLNPEPGGVGRYIWELCQGLTRREDVNAHFFGRNRLLSDPGKLLRGEELANRPGWLRGHLDKRALRSSVIHGPNYFLPAFAETGIITVHDLSVFRSPEAHPVERVRAFERKFLLSLSRSDHVITVSETVRRELIEEFALSPDDVTAVHLGVSEAFRPASGDAVPWSLQQWGLNPGQYGLCVSTLEPRKKISELLRAWRRLPAALRDSYPLALCGGGGWRNEQLHAQIRVGVAEGWLRHLGFVDEDHLPDLYAGATLFAYPSSYEGFGLPPVEAMASGVPVMVSRRSCLPEVCGDAARYFDPDDPDEFAATIEEALSDKEWQARSIELGLERARRYSWDRCIDGTVSVYLKVASAN